MPRRPTRAWILRRPTTSALIEINSGQGFTTRSRSASPVALTDATALARAATCGDKVRPIAG